MDDDNRDEMEALRKEVFANLTHTPAAVHVIKQRYSAARLPSLYKVKFVA